MGLPPRTGRDDRADDGCRRSSRPAAQESHPSGRYNPWVPGAGGGPDVEREFLELSVWDQFTQSEASAVAQALERCLPAPWRFTEVAWHELGDQRRFVAFFDHRGARFALIPGGEATLGYERGSLVLS